MVNKVLLLGDYSGLHSTLKKGLEKVGVETTLATNGDGWKKISGGDTVLFPTNNNNIIKKIYNYCIFPSIRNDLKGYDIVQAPGTNIYFWGAGNAPFRHIRNHNKKLFICAAGVDYYLYQNWKNMDLGYGYYMYDDNPELCSESDGKSISSYMLNRRTKFVMNMADGIIPVIPYEYEISYKNFSSLRKPILLPVNTDEIHYKKNECKKKIIFFHGINRVKDKGSNYIINAMKEIEKKYPNYVECIIADRMPYDKYLLAISRANVIIDQCKSFGYGINACISMAQGKVVMSGAEKKVIDNISDSCPIINIRPDVNQIVIEMEKLIDNMNRIKDISYVSRAYVEKYHNYIDIAEQYLETWQDD